MKTINSTQSGMHLAGGRRVAMIAVCAAIVSLGATVEAALNTSDVDIINLYLFNEQTSGQLANNPNPNQFLDTAPTGTAQNHDNFDDNPSDGPAYATGSLFDISGTPVGTGTGLIFTRSDNDRTRFEGWMSTSQGNYVNGGSFTVMIRLYATELTDDIDYNLLGRSSHFLKLQGVSGGGTSRIDVGLRDGGVGGNSLEDFWTHNSFGGSGDTIFLNTNTWYNLFLIYNANTSLTIALDDGTTFKQATSTTVPTGFDSLVEGFSDAAFHWHVGSLNTTPGSEFDGRIESIAIWDRALPLAYADGIGFATVPEPSAALLIGTSALLMLRRKPNRNS